MALVHDRARVATLDLGLDLRPVTGQRGGVASGFVVLPLGQGRLGDHRTDARLGLLGQLLHLLAGDTELLTQALQAVRVVLEPSLDGRPAHLPSLRGRLARAGDAPHGGDVRRLLVVLVLTARLAVRRR